MSLAEPEVVWVPRRGNGSRPVPDVSFRERVVLEALVGRLADLLAPYQAVLGLHPIDGAEAGERGQFENRPLQRPGDVVVIADVSSFYEYVDHDVLEQDVVELTGDVDLATALRQALREITGREVGIPQGPRSSDLLADLYLSGVDRLVRRGGLDLHRFNDDFLFAAKDRSEARQHLERLEAALRNRGLVLNHAKTRVVERALYEKWLAALDERLEGAALAVASIDFYGFDPVEFSEVELGDLSADAVEYALLGALDDREPDPYSINHRLIERALPLLAAAESTAPLDRLEEIVLDWGAHTRNLSLYLRALVGTDHELQMTRRVGETLVAQRGRTSAWVQGWLVDALANSVADLNPDALTWLQQTLDSESSPWFLRGRCAVALSLRGGLPEQSRVDEMFELSSATTRADLVAAAAFGEPSWAPAFVQSVAADPILSRVPQVATRPQEILPF